MSALNSYSEYSQLLFALLADRQSVASHAVTVYTTSRTIGICRGQVIFRSGHILRVFEQIDFVAHRIINYVYEATFQGEQLW